MRQNRSETARHSAFGTKENMLRRFLVPAVLCLALLLSGCSAVKDKVLRVALPEEDYQEYAELRDSGQLDTKGNYIVPDLVEQDESPQPEESGVHVTFARNEYIDICYYLDSDLKQAVPEDGCILKTGDCLYYDSEGLTCDHPYALNYSFDRFAVYEYSGDGKRGKELSWDEDNAGPNVVLKIPEDYKGRELSVMPLGRYEKRTLKFFDYYIDSSDHQQEMDGTWIVNDKEITGKSLTISPVDPLYVDYRYDEEKYAFVSSEPFSFYHDKGLVRFEVADALDSVDRYCVELRSLEGTFYFDPAQYHASHGTIEYQYNGKPLTEARYIPDGAVISYTATPEENYLASESTGQIFVNASAPEKTRTELKNAADFVLDKQVKVNLPRPAGGTIEYSANGAVLEGDKCTLRTKTVITMRFTPWNGWVCHAMDGLEYTVSEQDGQKVSIDHIDISSGLFEESDSYKPTLNLVLTESAKDIQIDLSNGETPVDESDKPRSYKDGNKTTHLPDWLGKNDRLVLNAKIGTYPNIALTFKNDTILSGSAMKLEIQQKDRAGNESRSIRYIAKLPHREEIELYDEQARIRPTAPIIETVTVTVSKVDIAQYQTVTAEHAVITAEITDAGDPVALHDGDMLEVSRNVKITITPEEGYYISGSKNDSGTYTQTLKYEKWEKDFQKILEKHPANKLWYVTLDTADAYGSCVYKLDGKEVSGSVGVHEGQELTLTYTLTDPDYRVVKGTVAGLIGKITRSETEQCDIPITEALDGQAITRADYISVEKKEG